MLFIISLMLINQSPITIGLFAYSEETYIDHVRKSTVFITTYDSLSNRSYATGVLAYNYQDSSTLFLITNKHCIEDKVELKVEIELISRNSIGTSVSTKSIAYCMLLDCNKKPRWHTDESDSLCDIAVLELSVDSIYTYAAGPLYYTTLTLDEFAEDDYIYEGENIFFIGFPLKIHGDTLPKAIVRGGLIASKDGRELKYLFPPGKRRDVYIIEAFGLKGSSGSPVILSPFTDVSLSRFPKIPKFIGITSGYRINHFKIDTTAIIIPLDTISNGNQLCDTIHCRIIVSIPENTWLYLVEPARKIKKILAKLDSHWQSSDNDK